MKTATWLLVLLGSAAFAWGAEIKLGWHGHVNATHYRIYMSTDGGNIWRQTGEDISQPSPFPDDAQIRTVIHDVPEDALVLFRASSMRGDDEAMAAHKGAWYDHRLSPPNASQLSVE